MEILDFDINEYKIQTYERASVRRRLYNFIIDRCITTTFLIIFLIIIYIFHDIFYPPPFFDKTEPRTFQAQPTKPPFSYIIPIGYFIFLFSYWILFEYFKGRTIGKMITNTKVVTIYGKKPSLTAIIIRTICRYIPFNILFFFNQRPQGLHDKFSNTVVIKDNYIP